MIEMLGFQLINNGVSLGSKVERNHMEGKKVADNQGKYFRVLHFVKSSNQKDDKWRKIRYEN